MLLYNICIIIIIIILVYNTEFEPFLIITRRDNKRAVQFKRGDLNYSSVPLMIYLSEHYVIHFHYPCTRRRKLALIFSGAETLSENIIPLSKQMIAVKLVFHSIRKNYLGYFTRTLYYHHALVLQFSKYNNITIIYITNAILANFLLLFLLSQIKSRQMCPTLIWSMVNSLNIFY